MNTYNKPSATDISLGNLIISIFDLYNLFTATELSPRAHEHAFWEMHIILNGFAEININGIDYSVQHDNILIIPKKFPHFATYASPDFKNCSFSFEFNSAENPPKMRYEFGYFSKIFNITAPLILRLNSCERAMIENILSNIDNLSIYGINKINTEIANFFLEISQKIGSSLNLSSDIFLHTSNQKIIRKHKIEVFLHHSLTSKSAAITLGDLADYLYISPRQTSRFIKEAFNLTFKELLTRHRMIYAKKLLNNPTLSAIDVAYAVGYSSYNGFLQAYKKYYGEMPR